MHRVRLLSTYIIILNSIVGLFGQNTLFCMQKHSPEFSLLGLPCEMEWSMQEFPAFDATSRDTTTVRVKPRFNFKCVVYKKLVPHSHAVYIKACSWVGTSSDSLWSVMILCSHTAKSITCCSSRQETMESHRRVASLLTGGHFPQILDLFRVWKLEFPVAI